MSKQQNDASAQELENLKKQLQEAQANGNTSEVTRLQKLIDNHPASK